MGYSAIMNDRSQRGKGGDEIFLEPCVYSLLNNVMCFTPLVVENVLNDFCFGLVDGLV